MTVMAQTKVGIAMMAITIPTIAYIISIDQA
jgi:hypothetical protein